MTKWRHPPSMGEMEALAEAALRSIPEVLRRHVANVAISVQDFADDATLAQMGMKSAWDLTGLYAGTPLTLRSVGDLPRVPDHIQLFRLPILLEWIETHDDLEKLVRSVLIHEVAHHFGFSDPDIVALERDFP